MPREGCTCGVEGKEGEMSCNEPSVKANQQSTTGQRPLKSNPTVHHPAKQASQSKDPSLSILKGIRGSTQSLSRKERRWTFSPKSYSSFFSGKKKPRKCGGDGEYVVCCMIIRNAAGKFCEMAKETSKEILVVFCRSRLLKCAGRRRSTC